MLLFVYGTLKRGGHFHSLLPGVYFSPAFTLPHYSLVDLGAFPALVEGGSFSVSGEVYDVDSFAVSDRIEGHPNFYRRKEIEVVTKEGLTTVAAYIYPDKGVREVRGVKVDYDRDIVSPNISLVDGALEWKV